MKRKVLACFLGLSLAATALSGCGNNKEKETEKVTEAVTEAPTEKVTDAETEAPTEAVTEAPTEKVTEAETEASTEKVTEAETEAPTEKVTDAETEAPTEKVTEAETEEVTVTEEAEVESQAAAEQETAAVTEAETEMEVATEAETETEAATEAETEAETETEVATEAETEAETETEAATEAETEAETETEAATEAETETEAAETEAASEAVTEAEDIAYEVSVSAESATGTLEDMNVEEDDVVILFESDVHGGISADEDYSGSSDSLGYAGLAAVKADTASITDQLTMIDLGDAIQGSVVTTESSGQDAMTLMEEIGYDICIPGNHEFDYGMDVFLEYAENATADFLSCNFVNTETGEAIFDGYKVVSYDVNGKEFQVGYVGICTPETIAKSTPTYFQDEDGNFIYGFSVETDEQLYETVQASVDAAIADGADCIVALGHLGDSGVEEAWSSRSVVENTTGIDVILDGHAHNTIAGEVITDKDGEDVLLAATGTKLENIGVVKFSVEEDGAVAVTSGLVNELTEDQTKSEAYTAMDEKVQEIQEQYAYLFVKVGSVDYDLVIYDPADGETRLVRTTETNMGDFLTDAYRIQSGADIAFLNGGSIRANISEGDITYMDLITVMPWNSETGMIEVTGQQILDCLEMGAHLYPEECGGFIQTSGLTYAIDTTMESSVNVNSDGEFVSVDGEYRVKDVMVGDEPLDLEKTYTLAINKYYSEECGDGMTMFKGSKVLSPAEGEEWLIDHDVVIDYLAAIGDKIGDEYADPYGQGRITLITADTTASAAVKEEKTTATEAETETAAETEAVTEAVTETETETAAETEVETEAVTEAETETETATEAETK